MARTKMTKRMSDKAVKPVLILREPLGNNNEEDEVRKPTSGTLRSDVAALIKSAEKDIKWSKTQVAKYERWIKEVDKFNVKHAGPELTRMSEEHKELLKSLNRMKSAHLDMIKTFTKALELLMNPADEHPGVEPRAHDSGDENDQGGPGAGLGHAAGYSMVAV